MDGMIEERRYASVLRAAGRVSWKLEDVLPVDGQLGFAQPFLPEALAGTEALEGFMNPVERRTLNQIRGYGYLSMFGLVEEFILPFVLERLSARLDAALNEKLALLTFAGEEAKHIELFRRFQRLFEQGFGQRCEMIGPASAIREHVLGRSELGVGLLILHIEWMTQAHYLTMVRADTALEPSFSRLLRQHWLEECQHARIDGWIVESVAAQASAQQRAQGFDDYVGLLEFFERGLEQQVELDREALERALGRRLDDAQRDRFRSAQRQAQRRTFLGSGVAHPRLRAAIEAVYPDGTGALAELAERYLRTEPPAAS